MIQYRDLTIMDIDSDDMLVYACDISASIGEKPADALKCPVELMSQMCVRVPLMELLAINAEPQLVINLCGAERTPTADRMIEGIKRELKNANLEHLAMNGSTEDNMTTAMTSIGITVVGRARKEQLLFRNVPAGALALQIGRPYVGTQLLAHFDDIVTYEMLTKLKKLPGVYEIVPIGSKGALNEAQQIARVNQLRFQVANDAVATNSIHYQSAGPATALVVAIQANQLATIQQQFPISFLLGTYEAE